ncbi:hypothetical protein NQ318_002988 [Aromia moschata]|uniref:Mos1 transposase HTH domain-containing protein n=1 Tax=Aromia moschata TaxID=1265417 RepID=A0AAV8YQE6_9CUCU|nr:hypothetical protein NQ318_002988 [Aromia moschata]
MQRSLEQRMAIKFCVKLEKGAAETIPMLKKAFGVDFPSDRQIFRWHKAFAEGREDVNDENRAGRPSTSSSDDNVKHVRDLLNTDFRLDISKSWKLHHDNEPSHTCLLVADYLVKAGITVVRGGGGPPAKKLKRKIFDQTQPTYSPDD